jgi:DNA invertase Pin-like site-specific DNA recombinase
VATRDLNRISGIQFAALDNLHASKLTIHIMAAVAEHEREAISERTKAAPGGRKGAWEMAGHAREPARERALR